MLTEPGSVFGMETGVPGEPIHHKLPTVKQTRLVGNYTSRAETKAAEAPFSTATCTARTPLSTTPVAAAAFSIAQTG